MNSPSGPVYDSAPGVTAAMDRRNGWIFTVCYACIYTAAPVIYVGIVQAALCDKLGAGPWLANLPASTYSLGQIAPLVFSWLIPHRLERSMVVWMNLCSAVLALGVLATLALPAAASVRIGAVVLQGLLQGLTMSTSQVFMLQCLRRGTSERGLALTLKRTFTVTPVLAVAGSLGAQYVLNPGFSWLPYPLDFALIYACGVPCALAIALAARQFELPPLADEPRRPFLDFLGVSLRGFVATPALLKLWLTYLLWYTSLGITSNLALFTRQAMGRDPKDFSGYIMAIRFGCKSAGGYGLGWLAVRYGLLAGVLAATGLLAAGSAWAWVAPGAAFLFAFGLLGIGELGGAYIPNYGGTLSSAAESTRNLAILTLATPASSFAPVLHGWLTEQYGFGASFGLGVTTALAALALAATIGAPPQGSAGTKESV